jgi:hypothetical protein
MLESGKPPPANPTATSRKSTRWSHA